MAFTAKDVQALREKTGVGMMECKKALTEANGDMEAAIQLLREKGLSAAAKKAGRIAAEGVVLSKTAGNVGVAVEVNAETDFVAKNADFMSFVDTVAQTILDQNPADVDALLALTIAGGSESVADTLREKILVIGENIKIRRFVRYEGTNISYVHGGGRIGVLVNFETDLGGKPEFEAYAKDVAMQIAAAGPLYVGKENVPEETIAKEKEILTAQAMNEGKPQNIAEKMVAGRISKYYKEFCLLEQPFVKDPDQSVAGYTKATAESLSGAIKVIKFARFEKGEGLEKKEENFADEVAGMMQ
ncbi:MAG: translation elongation factor Ts [Oscillospiraceae bacterium]|nr:translation elongation factor Ts [Oscillospiraceae bacterium]